MDSVVAREGDVAGGSLARAMVAEDGTGVEIRVAADVVGFSEVGLGLVVGLAGGGAWDVAGGGATEETVGFGVVNEVRRAVVDGVADVAGLPGADVTEPPSPDVATAAWTSDVLRALFTTISLTCI